MAASDELAYEPLADVVDRSESPEVVRRSEPWWRRWSAGRIVAVLVAILVAYYAISLVQVVATGRSDHRDRVDAIVVLGAAQYDGRPSPQLEARLAHAFNLWEAGVAEWVMVTGGKLPADRFTEAESSRRYLVERGVPESAVLMEDVGTTTYESLDAASLVLLAEGFDDVVLVSDSYHLKRSELIAGGFGLDARSSAAPDSVVTGWSSVRRHVRESVGVAVGRVIGFERLSDLAG